MKKPLETTRPSPHILSERALAALALLGGVTALTFSPLFVRWADAPAIITSLYRMLITAAILSLPAGLALRRLGQRGRAAPGVPATGLPATTTALAIPLVAGLFSGMDHALWGSGVQHTTVANATLLNYIAPLWVALFAVLVWKQRMGGRFWLGLLFTLGGAAAVLGSTAVLRPQFTSGDLLAVASSFFYAGYFLVVQRGRREMDTLPFMWLATLSCGLLLAAAAWLLRLPLTGYSPATYFTFLMAALVSQLGGYFSITYALGKLPATVVTPTMVAQPVLTALLSVPFAGETLILPQILGGAAALFGIFLINTAGNGKPKTRQPV